MLFSPCSFSHSHCHLPALESKAISQNWISMQNPFLLSCPTQTTASLWPPKMRCKCSHLLNSSCCLVTSESTVNTRCSLYDLNRPIHLSALPPVATLVRLSYHNWLLAVAFYLQYQTSELSFLTFSKTANVSQKCQTIYLNMIQIQFTSIRLLYYWVILFTQFYFSIRLCLPRTFASFAGMQMPLFHFCTYWNLFYLNPIYLVMTLLYIMFLPSLKMPLQYLIWCSTSEQDGWSLNWTSHIEMCTVWVYQIKIPLDTEDSICRHLFTLFQSRSCSY